MIVVDDRVLRSILVNEVSPALRRLQRNHATATTSCWLYRLCQAVHDPTVTGALSGPIASLPSAHREAVVAKLVRLPPDITLVSWRELAWTMAELVQRHRLNLLALEALAVARHLGADLAVSASAPSPLLQAAATAERIRVRSI